MLGCLASFFIFPCLMVSPVSKLMQQYGIGGFVRKIDGDCKVRLGKLHQAVEMYSADYDDRYPIADTWVEYTWRYGAKKDPIDQSESIFRCPDISMTRTGDYGYAFNKALSTLRKSSVENPDSTPMIFDSSDLARNANGDPEKLKPTPGRHEDGKEHHHNNAVMASGKVAQMP